MGQDPSQSSGHSKDSSQSRPRRRDYEDVLRKLEGRWKRRPTDRGRMMQEIVEALWNTFGEREFSWCGFYIFSPDLSELVLGPHQSKPVCTPIGLHGVCGRAASTKTTQVVPDVSTLGSAYIPCDPADRSEIAVPVMGPDGAIFSVLDADSHKLGGFDDEDRRWLERIVKFLGHSPAPVS